MLDAIQFNNAIIDDTIYFIKDGTNLVNDVNNANSILFEGRNKKHILIVYKSQGNDEISPIHRETLLKLVAAIGCTLDDIALVNYTISAAMPLAQLRQELQPTTILLFGINALELGLKEDYLMHIPYQIDEIQLVFTMPLELLDDNSKRILWSVLKKIF